MSAAECVCMPRIICSGHAWCQQVLPLLIAMHLICLFAWHYRYCIHCHQLALDFYWCNTHHTQKSWHTSYFTVCHGSGRPSIFNLTYLWYPLIAVQCADYMFKSAVPWYYFMADMLLPYFLKLPCVPIRGKNSKYGTRNTSGMNTGMPLILNNNNAAGVTDEVREITWFYKQR